MYNVNMSSRAIAKQSKILKVLHSLEFPDYFVVVKAIPRNDLSDILRNTFRIISFTFFFILQSSAILAQHTRLFACALASDEPTAFMGGSSIGAGLWQSDDTAKTWKQLGWKHVKCYSVDV